MRSPLPSVYDRLHCSRSRSRMGFKEDADFARFLSMGVVATEAVRRHLRDAHGHEVIELERFAMANKLWETKVKRLRLPDLLCVRCGRRVESRGKSQLGIILSHSEGRPWDAGGTRDDDLFAFVRVVVRADGRCTNTPAYFRTAAIRAMRAHAKESGRKAISEGSEVTLTWKTWVPTTSGTVIEIDDEERIVYQRATGGIRRYYQWRDWPERHLYVPPGSEFIADETMVAGIVQPTPLPDCPGATWDIEQAIKDGDATDRYAAVRAAGVRGEAALAELLSAITAEEQEDWRIRLEAAASLARLDPEIWTPLIAEQATDEDAPAEHRIEAVFVLAEIPTDAAGEALAAIAAPQKGRTAELRAAAVWGLGQGVRPRPELVLPFALDNDDFVALHAVSGLPTLPDTLRPTIRGWISELDDRRAAIAAQLLMRHLAIDTLVDVAQQEGQGQLWALRALGDLPPELVRKLGGDQLTPEVEAALEPMWIAQRDWLRAGQGLEGLRALDVQKVRFDPLP